MKTSKCCCCIRPRTGAIVIAVLWLIVNVIQLISTSIRLAWMQPILDDIRKAREQTKAARADGKITDDEYDDTMGMLGAYKEGSYVALGIAVVIAILNIVTTGTMLAGVLKQRKRLMFPWLVLSMILIVLYAIAVVALPIFFLVYGFYTEALITFVVGLVVVPLSIHFWMVVHTVHDEIGDGAEYGVPLRGVKPA